MLISDPPRRQRCRKAVFVELRIGARARHRPHIDNEIDTRFLKKFSELDDRTRGMAYGEEAVRFDSNLTAHATLATSTRIVACLSSRSKRRARASRRAAQTQECGVSELDRRAQLLIAIPAELLYA